MTPLKTAIYWIEYVIRYDGAKHMQSPAVHLNFIQKNSLDVLLMVAVIIYILLKLIVKIVFVVIKYRPLSVLAISILIYFLLSLQKYD